MFPIAGTWYIDLNDNIKMLYYHFMLKRIIKLIKFNKDKYFYKLSFKFVLPTFYKVKSSNKRKPNESLQKNSKSKRN